MVRAAVGLRERASFIRSPAQPALPRLGPLLSPTSAPRRAPFAGRINALVPVAPWHDASPLADPFGLTTLDVLRGLARARAAGFFCFNAFPAAEIEWQERPENGDMSWLADGRFLALAGPQAARSRPGAEYHASSCADLIPYFRRRGVTTVVRLNRPAYDAAAFRRAGLRHDDLVYQDGSNPPDAVLREFLRVCEEAPGAIAVHCKAGLGRTGTCIGAYMMKHYGFTAREAIGWMRVARPGSVIGPQQQFLEAIEARMWADGQAFKAAGRRLPEPAKGSVLARRQAEAEAASAAAAAAATTLHRSVDSHKRLVETLASGDRRTGRRRPRLWSSSLLSLSPPPPPPSSSAA